MSEEVKASGGSKKVLMIAAGAVILIASTIGATLALTGAANKKETEHAEAPAEAPVEATYINLAPEFVVNFTDKRNRPKFLKAELSVATKDPAIQEAITRHMPAIRNSIILLLSRQVYDDLIPNEGKEKLRTEALAAVQGVLQAQVGKPGVDDLFFGTFVMH